MLQKYIISIDRIKNILKIAEYAIIDKFPKKELASMQNTSSFSLLCEETYKSEMIEPSISEGISAVVASLRTPNFFPVGLFAIKIAESVTALYNSQEVDSMEVLLNDNDLIMG
ncbi:MAG: hypothetical protein R6U50_02055 [Desulfobacterales bacterium]